MSQGYCLDCYNLKVVKAEEFYRGYNFIRRLLVTCKANCWMTTQGKQKTVFLTYYIQRRKNESLHPFSIPRFTNVSRPCTNRITDYTEEVKPSLSILEARQILKKVIYA